MRSRVHAIDGNISHLQQNGFLRLQVLCEEWERDFLPLLPGPSMAWDLRALLWVCARDF